MALKLAEEQAVREMEAEKEEERTNPMKVRQHIRILLFLKDLGFLFRDVYSYLRTVPKLLEAKLKWWKRSRSLKN
jgi:hypothetical protein